MKNFEERFQAYLVFEFLFTILGYHKTSSLVAGISERKENFTHRLIRLMSGTHDHPDESPQSIVNNTCMVTHAVTLVKLVSRAVHFHANNNFYKYMCEPYRKL